MSLMIRCFKSSVEVLDPGLTQLELLLLVSPHREKALAFDLAPWTTTTDSHMTPDVKTHVNCAVEFDVTAMKVRVSNVSW